jgi:hypothetical protein
MSATEEHANNILCFCYKSPSETLQMLEEAYAKASMKRIQVYGWHKHCHASVSDDLRYRQYTESRPLSIYFRSAFYKQRNVCQNPSPQGCSEKETSRKMGAKQLFFFCTIHLHVCH